MTRFIVANSVEGAGWAVKSKASGDPCAEAVGKGVDFRPGESSCLIGYGDRSRIVRAATLRRAELSTP